MIKFESDVFLKNGIFEEKYTLNKSDNDYELFLSDVIYYDECSDNKVKLSLGDEHVTVDKSLIQHRDIISKRYGWSYEKECRLSLRLSDACRLRLDTDNLKAVCIDISSQQIRKMRDGRLVRSPIYAGGAEAGKLSSLSVSVDWEI